MAAAPALAQGGANQDYFRAGETHDGAQSLRNVEEFHLGPGIAKLKAGQYSQAYDELNFMLAYFPNHPQALTLASELCDLKWKNLRCDVEPLFERAIARNPNASQTYLVYGIHLQRANRLPQAIEAYKKSILLYPESGNAHYNLGLAYFDAKQFDLANQHANLSYALGMRLPGLREKLTRAGKWRPMEENEVKGLLDKYKEEQADARWGPSDEKASPPDAKSSPAEAKAK